jgi:MFS family permease
MFGAIVVNLFIFIYTHLGEILPYNIRGKGLGILEYMVMVGMLLGIMLTYLFVGDYQSTGWRNYFKVLAVYSLLMMFGGIYLLLESPRYLLTSSKFTYSFQVIQ